MARRFHRSVVRSGPRRSTSWFSLPPVCSTVTGEGGTLLYSLTAAELAMRPFTIVRTHLEVVITSDQVAADEAQVAGIGGCVVSDEALAIGITAVPKPVQDIDSDLFFFHASMINIWGFITAAGFDGNEGSHYTIDSKAMRKVDLGSDVAISWEIDTGCGAGTILTAMGRMLVKLH